MLAYWHGRNILRVVDAESSTSNTQSGQIIDVEGPAQEILKQMGVLEGIESKVTHGADIRFADDAGKEYARFRFLQA